MTLTTVNISLNDVWSEDRNELGTASNEHCNVDYKVPVCARLPSGYNHHFKIF